MKFDKNFYIALQKTELKDLTEEGFNQIKKDILKLIEFHDSFSKLEVRVHNLECLLGEKIADGTAKIVKKED